MAQRIWAAAAALLLAAAFVGCGWLVQRRPNPCRFYDGLPQYDGLSQDEENHDLGAQLASHVHELAVKIGPRSYRQPQHLAEAATYIGDKLQHIKRESGRGDIEVDECLPVTVTDETYPCVRWRNLWHCVVPNLCTDCPAGPTLAVLKTMEFHNIALRIPGADLGAEAIVVGAHYDSDACESCGRNPGADDNASGVAALMELARRVSRHQPRLRRTVIFVAFANEEEPFFHTPAMGSRQYLEAPNGPLGVKAMLSLETIGYYQVEPGSQHYLWPLSWLNWWFQFPDIGDFVAFVGNHKSASLVDQVVCEFQRGVKFPAEGTVALGCLPGIDWSDHWSFWKHDVPAVMVTDTAPNRNLCYHRECDVIERLDFDRMARVVTGLEHVIEALANALHVPDTPADKSACGCTSVG